MLNSIQNSILSLFKETLSDNRNDLIEVVFSNLEAKFNVKLSREENTNIYIFVSLMVDNILSGKLELITLIDNLNSFFDSNKFDGYNSGTYAGLHQALLSLSYVTDAKLSTLQAGVLAIILKLQDDVDVQAKKVEIATQIHKYISIGIQTDVPAETTKISAEINASTGQAIIYNFCECLNRNFDFEIKYFIDYEQNSREFDIEGTITNAILSIYNEKYNSVGKNFNVQDFYSISKNIGGIKRLDITLNELDAEGEIIDSFVDTDIEIADWEILLINEINLRQGN